MKLLAVIPARGGSKRIPGKNIRNFHGKPIISYSINAAVESGLFEEVMVSTDSLEISDISNHYGAKVPFLRSNESADDYATLADVLEEVIQNYHTIGKEWDVIACLLPTAPFIRAMDLKKAYNFMRTTASDAVVSVTRFSYPIQRALRITNGRITMANPEYSQTRSQELESMYHDAGQFYFIRTRTFLDENTLFCRSAAAYELDESRVQDIDTEADWVFAEQKYAFLLS